MEGNKILNTATGLHSVNELLKKYVREQTLSHEEKRDLWLFYKSINDTNSLIDFAEAAAHENIDKHIKQNQKKPMPFGKSILPYLTIWIACSMRAIQRKR